MKSIEVSRLNMLPASAAEVPSVMDGLGIPFESVAMLNWADEYPYCPDVKFRIAWCPEGLALHYKVNEQSVRARYATDGGKVWTDSCVECFIRNAADNTYYNIECNCIGTLLMSMGDGRHNRQPVAPELKKRVLRWASLGNEPFEEQCQPTLWEVALVIPTCVFEGAPLIIEEGAVLCANFYKCGDELSVPHFVSWNAIQAPHPDYHRPECFGQLRLL